MDKRTFIKNATASLILGHPMLKWINDLNVKDSNGYLHQSLNDEAFWKEVRAGYRLKPDYINLENGYYCFSPESTLEHFIDHVRNVNYEASYYMRTKQWVNKDNVANRLADLVGCGHDELIITRNTTESLDTIISGITWKEGDEAVMAEQDYGSMLNQFNLMAQRYGIVNRVVSMPNHPKSDEEIVQIYADAITHKTRLLMVSHMINITGQILPIRKICDMAHAKGVEVLVDGAHAIAHINFSIKELDCDYYGASLHKWLSVPLGAGLLYVKKEKIKDIWPVFAPWNDDIHDIRKLNHTGTHPVYTDLSIGNAIDFYNGLGPKKKESRLSYLKEYWYSKLDGVPRIIMNTPQDMSRSCGIANVGVEGKSPSDLANILLEKYKIWTVAIDGQGVQGCRITPNVYTSLEELDIFVTAMLEIAGS